MKTLKEWKGDFKTYVKPFDAVCEDIIDYFICVLPPANHTKDFLQCGEPVSHNYDNKPLYTSFERYKGQWYYTGEWLKRPEGMNMINNSEETKAALNNYIAELDNLNQGDN